MIVYNIKRVDYLELVLGVKYDKIIILNKIHITFLYPKYNLLSFHPKNVE